LKQNDTQDLDFQFGLETREMEYSLENFGPPLSTSPEFASNSSSVQNTPPNRSFASATKDTSYSWPKNNSADSSGWSFDIPSDILQSINEDSPGKNSKKKGKKIVLFGNGGSRGRS
jgi:hypothetical protein